MFRLFGRSGFWQLPRVPVDGCDEARDYCLIAGGIALVLSRCSSRTAHRSFPATTFMHSALAKFHRGEAVALDRELLSEVSHEIAEFTDQTTRDALLRRMRSLPQTAMSPGSSRPQD